jgi:hypothetical protein
MKAKPRTKEQLIAEIKRDLKNKKPLLSKKSEKRLKIIIKK